MRPELPSGTVTFLFTDVEGSTRLLHSLGPEGYADALAEHRALIRKACSARGGVEVDTQGDAFFFAFPTAPGALQAAGALTEALASGPIQVRVGLHTGTPLLTDEGYVGPDVHRAARIGAAGHGGQVLVSSSTRGLVEEELADLGEHRFKDLAAPERVYQLGEADFPPLKSLYRTNLPVPATPFLGRDRELEEVVELLQHDDVRLLTLTGPGGTGKTRLALQAVAEASDGYPDGVFWVPLAPLRDSSLVLDQTAQALGATEGLAAHVAGKRLLLLLDNFEHLLDAAPAIAELLLGCPNVDIVVTSRELLQLRAEHAYPVPTLEEHDGVALFLARARAVQPDLEANGNIGELCERLDNLPLALELAASRTRHLTAGQLLRRLGERLDLLVGPRDADPRQQTLRATIAWSHDLLEPAEQGAFARLSVFAGGWTLEAGEEVAGADLEVLSSLVDKSLVRWTGERYWMLETIREFAEEGLEENRAEELRRRHAQYFLTLGRSLGLTMENLERFGAQRHDVAIAEQGNFRAAIDWALDADLELAMRIAFSLENFWVTHDPQEGIRRFDAFLEREDELPVELRAAAHRCRGNVTIFAGDRRVGVQHYEAALACYHEAGDEVGALLMEHRAFVNREVGDLDERRQGLKSLLDRYRELGLTSGEVQVLSSLAGVERRQGHVDRALASLQKAAAVAESIGFAWTEQGIRDSLARIQLEEGRLDDAREEGMRALALARRTGDRFGAVETLSFFTLLFVRTGEHERAGVLWGAIEAEADRKPLGIWAAEERAEVEPSLPLDDADFIRGRERGRRLSFEDAVADVHASID